MLELDLVLEPFFESHYLKLTPERQQAFDDLLSHADPDLYNWLMGYGEPALDREKDIVCLIRSKQHIADPS